MSLNVDLVTLWSRSIAGAIYCNATGPYGAKPWTGSLGGLLGGVAGLAFLARTLLCLDAFDDEDMVCLGCQVSD